MGVATEAVTSADELWQHPEWISVDGDVYDLVALASVHPGGDHIRAFGGTDATAAFHSLHPYTAARNKRVLNERFSVLSEGRPVVVKDFIGSHFEYDSDFAKELKTAVREDVKARHGSWYAGTGFWCRTLLVAAATLCCEWLWISTGHLAVMVTTGVCHALIGLAIQHDASHGALSCSPTINAIFSYGADWIGNSRWLWFQQHVIGHHPHTNVEDVDGDVHSAEPFLQFSEAPLPTGFRRHLIRHQALFMHLVLAMYGPSVVYDLKQVVTMDHGREIPNNPWMRAKAPFALCMRMFFFVRVILLPMLIGGAPIIAALVGVPLVNGAILTFLFVVSHNFDGSNRHPLTEPSPIATISQSKRCWYAMQASTSCSYGGFFAGFCTGGLNMQIEHHLFPRMSSWEYPAIAPVVRRVCEKHGVSYVYYPTLWENLKSTWRYMGSIGETELEKTKSS